MPATIPVSRRLRALAAVTCLGLLVVACGDDDDTEASAGDDTATTAAEGESADVDEYCAFIEELDSQEDLPSEEQLNRLKELRPEEIGEETDLVADAFIEAEGDVGQVFSDPAIEEAFGKMEAHDAEVCGFEAPEDEGDELETEAAEGAAVVPVTGVDFAFEGIPSDIAAGPTAFEFTNEGDAAHELVVFELGDGVDLDELLASEEEPAEDEAREVGGTFAPPGEGGVFANVDLTPGTYAAVCFIPGPEGKAHHELGMKTTFQVS